MPLRTRGPGRAQSEGAQLGLFMQQPYRIISILLTPATCLSEPRRWALRKLATKPCRTVQEWVRERNSNFDANENLSL